VKRSANPSTGKAIFVQSRASDQKWDILCSLVTHSKHSRTQGGTKETLHEPQKGCCITANFFFENAMESYTVIRKEKKKREMEQKGH
jgi:hypothetical protein